MSYRFALALGTTVSALALAISLTAVAPAPAFAQNGPPNGGPTAADWKSGAGKLMGRFNRIDNDLGVLAGKVRHLDINSVYCAGRTPGKREKEAEVAAMEARVDALVAEYGKLKSDMAAYGQGAQGGYEFSKFGKDPTKPDVFKDQDAKLADLQQAMAEKKAKMAASRIINCDHPHSLAEPEDPPVKADPPSSGHTGGFPPPITPLGGQSYLPGGTLGPTTPLGGSGASKPKTQPTPVKDGLAQPPPAPAAPMFEKVSLFVPPAFFCSERARSDYLLDVYYPAAQKASRNRIAAHTYLVAIRGLRDWARAAGDAKAEAKFQAELDAWQKIYDEADQLFKAIDALRAPIELKPVINCIPQTAMRAPAAGALLGALQSARGANPVNRVGATTENWGMAMAERPFDGSEAQNGALVAMSNVMMQPRRERTSTPTAVAAIPPAVGEPALTTPPQATDEALLVVDEPPKPAPPVELAAQPTPPINDGPVVQPEPTVAVVPPPPPAQPFYPDCPEHPGMPGTPEHIRLYHGG